MMGERKKMSELKEGSFFVFTVSRPKIG